MEVLQHEDEMEEMLDLYNERAPKRVLEIGTWDGGTLREWLRNGSPRAVVAIDDKHRNDGQYGEWLTPEAALYTLTGKSQDHNMLSLASLYGPYEWVFVDADHSYAPVKADWENYRSMVEPGGVFLFHDIIGSNGEMGVHDLWQEIKAVYPTREIGGHHGAWGGIGVVYL